MEIFKLIFNFFKKRYWLFLLVVVLISYGQILRMHVWQDDNALFFKLAHIEGKAGYLGEGPFGDGAYKYTTTPYIPIYQLFGFSTLPYFLFTFTMYFITALCVYKVLSSILGEDAGKLVGFLYSCGYIASDGFIRLFNSITTSISVILVSLLTLCYWFFYKERKKRWYLLALVSFLLSLELVRARTHYLIGVIILFEILFLISFKNFRSLVNSAVRLIPFITLFFYYFIVNADHRSSSVKVWIVGILQGQYHQSYSFLTALTSVFLPNWLTDILWNIPYIKYLIIFAFILIIYLLFKTKYRVILMPIFGLFSVGWIFLEKQIFTTPVLDLSQKQHFLIFLGGMILLILPIGVMAVTKFKKLFLFMLMWTVINIVAYSVYNPTTYYYSINRYFAHSFLSLIVALGILYSAAAKNFKKIILFLIIIWGLGNLTASYFYQREIVTSRSDPPREFYKQLKEFVPTVSPGDVFYFDVADSANGSFQEAFSVAQMPETTAIAWRYGVDRYDIQRFTEFTEFAKYLNQKKVMSEKVHTFWYTNQGLVDTTGFMREVILKQNPEVQIAFDQEGEVLNIKDDISVSVPLELSFEIETAPLEEKDLSFHSQTSSNQIHRNPNLKQLAIDYFKVREEILNRTKFSSTSQWRDRVLENVHDQNPDTVWQADRVLWQKKQEALTLDIGLPKQVNRFVWINGFSNNSPTKYKIELSLNGEDWKEVWEIDQVIRIDTKDPQIIEFDPQLARFFRMTVYETLGGDSPAIAEAWVVPAEFRSLNIQEAETFIKAPFSYVGSYKDYTTLMQLFDNKGFVSVYWMSNKRSDWQTEPNKKINLTFDEKARIIQVDIPAGGTRLDKLKFSSQIPGRIIVKKISGRNLIK